MGLMWTSLTTLPGEEPAHKESQLPPDFIYYKQPEPLKTFREKD